MTDRVETTREVQAEPQWEIEAWEREVTACEAQLRQAKASDCLIIESNPLKVYSRGFVHFAEARLAYVRQRLAEAQAPPKEPDNWRTTTRTDDDTVVCSNPDQCCRELSRVWKALGVAGYNGKSASENVTARLAVEREAGRQEADVDNAQRVEHMGNYLQRISEAAKGLKGVIEYSRVENAIAMITGYESAMDAAYERGRLAGRAEQIKDHTTSSSDPQPKWTVWAAYVLGGWHRDAADAAGLTTAVQIGLDLSPIGEVTITQPGKQPMPPATTAA